MVTVFFWNKGQDGRRFNVKRYYHLEHEGVHCWEEQGLDYLKRNPYVSKVTPCRIKLNAEDSRKRLLILKRKARLDQQRRGLNTANENYLTRCLELDAKVAALMQEILPVGGIPKSWISELLSDEMVHEP